MVAGAKRQSAPGQLYTGLDAGERGAQLVAGSREKFAALPSGLLSSAAGGFGLGKLPGQACTGKRFASQPRDSSKEILIPRREVAGRVWVGGAGTPNGKQAYQVAIDHHRRSDGRLQVQCLHDICRDDWRLNFEVLLQHLTGEEQVEDLASARIDVWIKCLHRLPPAHLDLRRNAKNSHWHQATRGFYQQGVRRIHCRQRADGLGKSGKQRCGFGIRLGDNRSYLEQDLERGPVLLLEYALASYIAPNGNRAKECAIESANR